MLKNYQNYNYPSIDIDQKKLLASNTIIIGVSNEA